MEQPADTKFEIGYMLFIDIVGYSTLHLNEQRNAIETLNHIVRETGEFPNRVTLAVPPLAPPRDISTMGRSGSRLSSCTRVQARM